MFALCLSAVHPSAKAQVGQWAWVQGDTTYDAPARLGTQGSPGTTVTPNGLSSSHTWKGKDGMMWLWGGRRRITGGLGIDIYGDLWRFNPTTRQWTWMKGSGQRNDGGSIGPLGVESPTNRPPSSAAASTWTDTAGNLWLYGGLGQSSYTHGLWRYSVVRNMWSIRPSGNAQDVPVYGTRGVESATTHPGSVIGAVSWTTPDGMLYLYGGQGYGPAGAQVTQGGRNSLWRYNPRTERWTWLKGRDNWNFSNDAPGSYGTTGQPDTGNLPQGRRNGQIGWTDRQGNLWLYQQDMWKFDPATGNWTCIIRDTTLANKSLDYCYLYQRNKPRITFGNGNAGLGRTPTWTDSSGRFWLFQGNGYRKVQTSGLDTLQLVNGLWCFDPILRRWSFVKGNLYLDKRPRHGVRGVASAYVDPGDRGAPSVWYDRTANGIYLFGGDFDTTTITQPQSGSTNPTLNDVLFFRMAPDCPSVQISPQAGFALLADTVCPFTPLPLDNKAHFADTIYYVGQGLIYDPLAESPVLTQPGRIDVRQIACNLTGCDTSAPHTFIVLSSNIVDSITASPAYAFCNARDTVHLQAEGNGNASAFQWYRSDTLFASSQAITVTDTGQWVLIAGNACASSVDTIRLYQDRLARPNLGPDTTVCRGSSITLDAGTGYLHYSWNGASGGQTFTITQPGTYTVLVSTESGCRRSDTIQIDTCVITRLSKSKAAVIAIPNPATVAFRLDGSESGDVVTIYDLQGRTVLQTVCASNHMIYVSGLASGMYRWVLLKRDGQLVAGALTKH